jgi:hypothetical protein
VRVGGDKGRSAPACRRRDEDAIGADRRPFGLQIRADFAGVIGVRGLEDGVHSVGPDRTHVLKDRRGPLKQPQHRFLAAARGIRISNALPGGVDGVGVAAALATNMLKDGDVVLGMSP